MNEEVFNIISIVTANTASALSTADIINYSIIAVIALIIFLALKEILSANADKSKRMKSFSKGSNIAIVPLVLIFVVIVAYKVMTVIR